MSIQSDQDLIALQRVGRAVAVTVQEMFATLRPGMTTRQLDQIGAMILAGHGARPAPKLCYGFPGSTIISINEEACHAVPGDRVIHEGDLVNIDVSAEINGYFADTGATQPVGLASSLLHRMCAAAREALAAALRVARHGVLISEIERAFRKVAKKHGFSLIEDLTGHGVGRHVHEAPENIPWYGRRNDPRVLQRNQVITIEPFISNGARRVRKAADGWTLYIPKGYYSAQFEHTIVVSDNDPIILTHV